MRTFAFTRELLLAAAASLAFVAAGPALAQATLTPDVVPGVEIIDSKQAKALMDKGVKMFDVRVPGDYAELHIKGAISLPYTNKSENVPNFDGSKDLWDVTKLPADKAQPIIIQGNAPAGWRHYKASVLAVKAGHKKVYWLRNGIDEWKKLGLPTE